MWRCGKCDSNLLDHISECPVCKLPAESVAALNAGESEMAKATNYTWMWVLLAFLVPPVGVLVLLVLLARKLIPDRDPA